jgi:hypothetical protein
LRVVGARVVPRLMPTPISRKILVSSCNFFNETSANHLSVPLIRLCAILHSPYTHVVRHACIYTSCTAFDCDQHTLGGCSVCFPVPGVRHQLQPYRCPVFTNKCLALAALLAQTNVPCRSLYRCAAAISVAQRYGILSSEKSHVSVTASGRVLATVYSC